ncbi:hypothetical protein E5A73_16395 [Sphingomonas gei]|uniref:Uncharacterized protein n=1 Tax=Sphingomonas gei TaxID=1395960 RepID=A0A4V3QZ03_9SPHN|nr:hypothetical protein [Sphingomonas gei]TGX52372.1 hypothetical protein E5A73_16395 [Sphingomonas gei]
MMNRVVMISFAIMSAGSACAISAREQPTTWISLIAPEEAAWFKLQPPGAKRKILADLRRARACVAGFAKRDGRKDAVAAARLPSPRFYSGISNGVVVYRTVPAVQGCSPEFISKNEDQHFRELADAYSGPPRTMKLQRLCGEAASTYAATFNRTLARIKPEAFNAACPKGRLGSTVFKISRLEAALLQSTQSRSSPLAM